MSHAAPSPAASPSTGSLRRELGTFGAVMMGLGSIIGTGVFVSIGIAAGVAGPSVILAIAIAAAVALCNALSSAQLAANHPTSGGTYEYGYVYLTPWLGFSAGWMFLCAKSASAATAALGFAGYVLVLSERSGDGWRVGLAVFAVLALVGVVLAGIRRSNMTNVVIVAVTLASLVFFVLAGLPGAMRSAGENLWPFFQSANGDDRHVMARLMEASALMFVAYTGYGRIATMGEEVQSPRQTIPRAIVLTMIVSMTLYIAVAAIGVCAVGAAEFGSAQAEPAAPLATVASRFAVPGAAMIVSIGAITAMLGVLLNLILGLSRILLAMGRRSDAPRVFAKLSAHGTTPTPAVVMVGVLILLLVSFGSIKLAWSFSAFTVLVYYAITNLAAIRLPREQRLYSPAIAWCGLIACLALAFWVEYRIWIAGLLLLLTGLAVRAIMQRMQTTSQRAKGASHGR